MRSALARRTVNVLQRSLVDRVEPLSPEQELACAVLKLAVSDALHHPVPVIRAQMVAWFEDSEGFRFWCQVADISPAVVLREFRRLSTTWRVGQSFRRVTRATVFDN